MVCPDDISQQKNIGKIPPVNLNQTHGLGLVFSMAEVDDGSAKRSQGIAGFGSEYCTMVEAFQLDLQTAAPF